MIYYLIMLSSYQYSEWLHRYGTSDKMTWEQNWWDPRGLEASSGQTFVEGWRPLETISFFTFNLYDKWICEILSKHQLNHNLTQPNITLVGLDVKMTLRTTSPHPTNRNSMSVISQLLLTWFWPLPSDSSFCILLSRLQPNLQEYLSCNWPNFNETLKVGS